MNNVLIRIYVPFIEEKYDIYVPINKKIGTVKKKIISSIVEMSNVDLSNDHTLNLYEKETGAILDNSLYVKNSIIRNGTQLILL